MPSSPSLVTVVTLLCATSIPALADPIADLAFDVREASSAYHREWVITKLTSFQLGKKCLAKLTDKGNDVINTANFYARDIAEYAQIVTGDDWASIENQNTGTRETNKDLVAPMVEAFRKRLSVSISVEGDDCNAKDGLWLKYWYEIGKTLKAYPPRASSVKITLTVTTKAKDVTATVDRTGSVFSITAPRDIEVRAWDLSKPFRKVARPL